MTTKATETLTFQWPNRLRAVLQENHDTPVVSCAIYVRVGSADETPEQAGLAHFHEHMIFKGTPRRPLGAIASEIEGAGGEINAYTTFDHTCYYVSIASKFWLTGLDVLTDAVSNAALESGEVDKERNVILEEMKRAEDTPAQIVGDNLLKSVFHAHPYRRPIIGTRKSVTALSAEQVRAFFRNYYTPSNMVVVLTGDFDAEAARLHLDQTLGRKPWRQVARPARAKEPAQRRPRIIVDASDVHETTFEIAFPAPDLHHPEAAALDVLALILGSGESSRLTQRVKRGRGLVHEGFAYNYSLSDHGLLAAGGVCDAPKALRALRAVHEEVDRLRARPVTASELDLAKRNIEADFIFDRETPFGRAKKLGYSMLHFGDLEFENRYLRQLAAVTPQSVLDASRRWLRPEALSASVLVPRSVRDVRRAAVLEALTLEPYPMRPTLRAKPAPRVAAGAPSTVDAIDGLGGRLTMARLDNGVRVIVKESAQAPILCLRACVAAGSRYETERTAGLSRFVSALLTSGTRKLGARAFAHAVESIAGGISGFSGRNSMGLTAEFLSRHKEEAFALTAQALLEPAFAEEEIERRRKDQIAAIQRREDALDRRCLDLFQSTLFTRHPYRLPTMGALESVAAFTRSGLRAFYNRTVRPDQLVIAVVGDITVRQAMDLAEKHFGGFSRKPGPELKLPVEPERVEPTRVRMVRDKEQAHLVIGFRGTSLHNRDRFAVEVLNAVMSGQGGRLFLELRDRRHLAYSVSSFNQEGVEPGALGIYIGTSHANVDAAREGIWSEIERLRETPIGDDELASAKRYLIGSTQIDMAHLSSLALTMALDELLGVGYRDHFRLENRIERVTAQDVRRAARKYLRRESHVEALMTDRDAE